MRLTRRDFLTTVSAAGAAALIRPTRLGAYPGPAGPILTRAIPSSGEMLPLVGLGSSVTFNVGDDQAGRARCADVMKDFFASGGRLVDSSPMYGSSQAVIGYGLKKLGDPKALFSADKVWTGGSGGPKQIAESEQHWGVKAFDLLQVHNLMDWETHLPMLFEMKKAGKLRYVGVTTSHGRRHGDLEKIMSSQPLDFVQFSYSAGEREAEQRLLPLAKDRKIAVICNRPFMKGDLIERVAKTPLPSWAAEIDCTSWAQVLLKFVVSHPAVNCAIPATSNPEHERENIAASYGRIPNAAMRARIAEAIEKL